MIGRTMLAAGAEVGGAVTFASATLAQVAQGSDLCTQAMIGLVVMLLGYVLRGKLPPGGGSNNNPTGG